MVRRKPVVAFGLCWYENYSKGVLRVTDEKSAEGVLSFIENYKYDEDSLMAYLASVGRHTHLAYYFKASRKNELDLSKNDCVNNIVKAMLEQLQ